MISLKDALALDLLEEGSFLPADVPRSFYCAVTFKPENEDNIMQFVNRRLNGIQGITEKESVALGFLGESGRNALLIMNGAATVSENRLSKILYKNPHYLASGHLKIADRITANKMYTDTVFKDAFQNLILFLYAKPATQDLAVELENDVPALIKGFRQAQGKFDDIKSVARWIFATWQKLHPERNLGQIIPYEKIVLALEKSFKSDMGAYSHEKEWIIKDKILNIPKNSYLIFRAPFKDELMPYREIAKKYNLENEYQVRFTTN